MPTESEPSTGWEPVGPAGPQMRSRPLMPKVWEHFLTFPLNEANFLGLDLVLGPVPIRPFCDVGTRGGNEGSGGYIIF